MNGKSFFEKFLFVAMSIAILAGVYSTVADYNIGTGYLARVSPVIAAGNIVAVTTDGLLYDSGASAYSAGTAMAKVVPAAAGNLASLSIAGQIYDSGAKLSDYMTPAAMAAAIMTFGKVKTAQVAYDTSAGVTDAVCDNALGAPGTFGAGYQATIKSSIGSALYKVETDGTSWFFSELTIAP